MCVGVVGVVIVSVAISSIITIFNSFFLPSLSLSLPLLSVTQPIVSPVVTQKKMEDWNYLEFGCFVVSIYYIPVVFIYSLLFFSHSFSLSPSPSLPPLSPLFPVILIWIFHFFYFVVAPFVVRHTRMCFGWRRLRSVSIPAHNGRLGGSLPLFFFFLFSFFSLLISFPRPPK